MDGMNPAFNWLNFNVNMMKTSGFLGHPGETAGPTPVPGSTAMISLAAANNRNLSW
jgi:hypothetical protein